MLYKKLSGRTAELLLLSVMILMYIAMCAEADMYVPAFPEMVKYFSTTEDKIQLILSLNFAGLCIASLVSGPLSDAFGRRKVLLTGLLLFFLSSLGCVFSENFTTLLFWRVIQGMATSVPMVVSTAVFLDKFSLSRASQLIGIMNSVITAAMAGAPIIGSWLITVYQWQLNFVVIAVLGALSLLGTFLVIEETLPPENRKKINFGAIFKDYATLISSFKFVGYSVIALLPFTAIVVYISNLSLILVNHFGMSLGELGYYQATTMGTYLVFSALSSILIAKKGIETTKNIGGILATIGGTALLLTALYQPNSVTLICSSMAIFAAGGSMMVGIFGMKALELYPEMKGTASAMITAIRQLLAAGSVFIAEFTFNGSIVPVAYIIFAYVCISAVWYMLINLKNTVVVHNAVN